MITYTDSIEGISSDQLGGFFVGWPNPPLSQIHLKLLENSDKAILAVDDESRKVVGFVTAISDGVLCAYITFLEVLPEYQSQGIGTKLTRMILEHYNNLYMIDLTCDAGLQPFYGHLGMDKATGMIKRNYNRQSGE